VLARHEVKIFQKSKKDKGGEFRRPNIFMDWYYILLICVGAVVLLLFALALIAYNFAFGARCDKNPLLKYFTAEDFSLTASAVSVKQGKNTLRGFLYTKEGAPHKNALAVFCHGLGAGHAAYMTEINFLCEKGFTVLALDNRGCDLSDGKSIKGMYSGVQTAKAAVDFARGQECFNGYKICLIGHSWGGYSALCASTERKVDAVVALSAPVSPIKTFYYASTAVLPMLLAAMLIPFVALADFMRFGFKSNKHAAKCADKSGIPTLLVQGDRDTVVPLKKSAYAYAKGKNVEKYVAKNKSHNPYNTPEAQEMMIELSQKLAKARKMSEEEKKYFEDFDFVAATREDGEVMGKICEFLQNNMGL